MPEVRSQKRLRTSGCGVLKPHHPEVQMATGISAPDVFSLGFRLTGFEKSWQFLGAVDSDHCACVQNREVVWDDDAVDCQDEAASQH